MAIFNSTHLNILDVNIDILRKSTRKNNNKNKALLFSNFSIFFKSSERQNENNLEHTLRELLLKDKQGTYNVMSSKLTES